MSNAENKTLLDRLPADILARCLEFAAPEYVSSNATLQVVNVNANYRVLQNIVDSDNVLSDYVKRVALELSYRSMILTHTEDVNRLHRLFSTDRFLAGKVRSLAFGADFLLSRPPSQTTPSNAPRSPPQSAAPSPTSSPSASPALSYQSNVEMIDIDDFMSNMLLSRPDVDMIDIEDLIASILTQDVVDQKALEKEPIHDALVRHYRNTVLRRNNELVTNRANVFVPNRWVTRAGKKYATAVLLIFRLLLKQTGGLVSLTSRLLGMGVMPLLDPAFMLTKLRRLKLIEYGFDNQNEGVPRTLDLGGLLLRGAPNLEELELTGFRYFLPPMASTGSPFLPPSAPALFPKLRHLVLFSTSGMSQCSLDRLLSVIGPDCLEKFGVAVSLIGTAGRIQRRQPRVLRDGEDETVRPPLHTGVVDDPNYHDGYKELTLTCHGIVKSLLPWRKSLRRMILPNAGNLAHAYNTHLSHRGLEMTLGTSLLPEFERLESITMCLHLFNTVHAKWTLNVGQGQTDAGGQPFENQQEVDTRLANSLAYNLPPNIRILELALPELSRSPLQRERRLAKALADSIDHRKPIVGLLKAVLDGKYPKIERIDVMKYSERGRTNMPHPEHHVGILNVPGSNQRVELHCTEASFIVYQAMSQP